MQRFGPGPSIFNSSITHAAAAEPESETETIYGSPQRPLADVCLFPILLEVIFLRASLTRLNRKGLADELLSKREEERGRKRDRDVSDSLGGQDHMSKRARSESSHSMNSVSTISTSRSHSRSPPRHSDGHDRTGSRHSRARKRRYSDSSSGRSVSSSSSHERIYSQSHEWTHDRNTRRRRQESSPGERGRARELSRNSRQRNKSRSRDRGLIAKGRRSMTPEKLHEQNYPRRHSRDNTAPSEPSHNRFQSRRSRHDPDNPANQPRREGSLSPFSKRLALTQAMNAGK